MNALLAPSFRIHSPLEIDWSAYFITSSIYPGVTQILKYGDIAHEKRICLAPYEVFFLLFCARVDIHREALQLGL